ncbi:MAG: hypothetical protein WCO42_01200 [bacterium]
MQSSGWYCARTLRVMVVMPLVFLVIYPPLLLLLPETLARLADLPRDLALVVLVDVALVPLVGIWLYYRARQGGERRATPGTPIDGARPSLTIEPASHNREANAR